MYIKKNYISLVFNFIIVGILLLECSCSIKRVIRFTDVLVVTYGNIPKDSTFVIMRYDFQKSFIEYDFIKNKINNRLKVLGYTMTNNKIAKYAILFVYHDNLSNISMSDQYKSNLSINSSYINNRHINRNYDFSISIFRLKNNKIDKKVFQAFIKQNDKNKSNQYYNMMKFNLCSIDAIFSKNIINKGKFKEYKFQCLESL